MSESLFGTVIFLINTLFDLYLVVLCARLILAWQRADYFNPVTRFIIKVTQPIVAPVRRLIPTFKGIEFATLFCIIVIEYIKFILLNLIAFGEVDFIVLLGIALIATLKLILTVFFYAILIGAIMSFLSPGQTPITQVLWQISSPILTPFRRSIPPIGGMDISPIPALILLQVVIRLLP